MQKDKKFFPLFVDLTEKRIVVIGAGAVAGRRVQTLLAFAGEIHVVAPEAQEELLALAQEGKIVYHRKCYERKDLYGADLVLAATDDAALNEEIYSVCKCLGILVNSSSNQKKCDFHFPGILEYEDVVMGFNGSGRDHKKVKKVREKVEKLLKKDWEE